LRFLGWNRAWDDLANSRRRNHQALRHQRNSLRGLAKKVVTVYLPESVWREVKILAARREGASTRAGASNSPTRLSLAQAVAGKLAAASAKAP
jgi:hypothetical protein